MKKALTDFLNLEKRHYTNKLIPKLVLEDATEITDQKDIIREQERFYEKLYTSRETQFTADHSTTFFNQDSTRAKLTPEEKDACEGNISAKECLYALKSMVDGKSPGMDDFTRNFIILFWKDLCHYLVRSISFSYSIGEMSVTQRSALITTLPRPNKKTFYLKKIGDRYLYLESIIKQLQLLSQIVLRRFFQPSYHTPKKAFLKKGQLPKILD